VTARALALARKLAARVLERKTFRTSRLAEFASVAELVKQTGHPVSDWPLVVVKELVDNALDAAEEAGIAPSIAIVVDADSITVADRGPGIATTTVESLIDYSVRTSSRAAYVSPTRGAQGNALQSILAMGFALASRVSAGDDSEDAAVLIESRGVAHRIAFAVDPVRQTPVVSHADEPSDVKIGAKITVRWPNTASSIVAAAKGDFLQLISTFACLNPHLTLSAEWRASEPPVRLRSRATDPDWRKWGPSQPTSPHWYNAERLTRRMAAEIAYAEDHEKPCPSVRELVGEFRGLSGTAKGKTICEAAGAERLSLADFHARGAGAAAALLAAMKLHSRPVKPRDLGVVGSDHLRARFAEFGADPETFVYKCVELEHDGLPYVIEAAFACRGDDDEDGADIIEGFNFTPAIGASPFRLEGRLAEARVQGCDPVIGFVHLTSPRLDFLDKGKAMSPCRSWSACRSWTWSGASPRSGRSRRRPRSATRRRGRGARTRCAGATGR
jgi:DNA topoisomerase VI subunit B